jgi:hypothetical protein
LPLWPAPLHFFFFFLCVPFFAFLHLAAWAIGLALAGTTSVPPTSAAIKAASVILLISTDTEVHSAHGQAGKAPEGALDRSPAAHYSLDFDRACEMLALG